MPPQPAAQGWLRAEHAGTWDAIVLYDIPGLVLARGPSRSVSEPSQTTRSGLLDLLAAGRALSPSTTHSPVGRRRDAWATCLAVRFLYAPGVLHGHDVPASGYRMERYRVDVAAPEHPVCAGVESFEVDDELYLLSCLRGPRDAAAHRRPLWSAPTR